MVALAFDTHLHVKRLVQAGVSEAQAEALIDAVTQATELPDVSQLASKEDVDKVRVELTGEIRTLGSRLDVEIAGVRGEIRTLGGRLDVEIAGVKGEIAGLRGEIKGLKAELIWWVLGAIGVTAVLPQVLAHVVR